MTTAEQVENPEPISAHPDKLKDQLADNAALIEDLDKRLAALDAVRATADELAAQSGMDDKATRGKYLIHVLCENYKWLKPLLEELFSVHSIVILFYIVQFQNCAIR